MPEGTLMARPGLGRTTFLTHPPSGHPTAVTPPGAGRRSALAESERSSAGRKRRRARSDSQAIRYFLFGEGETGLMVHTLLLRGWDWTLEEDVRPLTVLMSD